MANVQPSGVASEGITVSSGMLAGNLIGSIGDSITSGGVLASGSLTAAKFTAQSYMAWAMLLSGGRIAPATVAAGPGLTIPQIISTHLPTMLAASPKPSYCVVLGGTNDVGAGDTVANMGANLKIIYNALLGAGIRPIACAIPPRNADGAALKALANKLNYWIGQYAAANGIPFVNFYDALVNVTTGSYTAGLDVDGIHPSGLGAKAMGQALCDRLVGTNYLTLGNGQPSTLLGSYQPFLADNNTDTSSTIASGNKVFLTDSGAPAGLATGLTLSGTGTPALVVDASTKGNLQQLTRAASNTQISSTAAITIAAGDVVAWACRIGAAVKTAVGDANFSLMTNDGAQHFFSLAAWTEDIPNGSVIVGRAVVPSGLASSNMIAQIAANTAAGAVARIGQLQVLNLTALGLL